MRRHELQLMAQKRNNYKGYLKPYMPLIERMYLRGESLGNIAYEIRCQMGGRWPEWWWYNYGPDWQINAIKASLRPLLPSEGRKRKWETPKVYPIARVVRLRFTDYQMPGPDWDCYTR